MLLIDRFVRFKRFGRFKRLLEREPLAVRPFPNFPRIIHLYWDQGLEDAPPLIHRCIESWRAHHPEWIVRIWNAETASDIVDRSAFPPMTTTHYSDILRIELLLREGGVWVDATILCTKPLDGWLPHIMAQCEFFAFSRPGPDRPVATWFLSAWPGNLIGQRWMQAIAAFWARPGAPMRVYHWFHYLFEYLLRTSPRFRRSWRDAPRLSALPLLALQLQLIAGDTPTEEDWAFYRNLPMHKLTFKREIDLSGLGALDGRDA